MASLTLQVFCLIATGLLTVHGLSPTLATTPGGCLYRGKFYPVGSFQLSPCEPCHCTSSGQAYCEVVDCFFIQCVDYVHDKNHCCPVCPNGPNCRIADGSIIKHGDTYSMGDRTCRCTGSQSVPDCDDKLQSDSVDPLPFVG
uniref:von Willebrand factor C domain-containing protein 2-like n=1 Tax=Crassostrea virginica TaxID=6565 RepID=A0A8B8DCA3_CRAVI|nr:von Willebrand factor C domain-containing protein 2-like [Crassostrea virginica]